MKAQKLTYSKDFNSLLSVANKFRDNETCIDFLERKYWGDDKSNVSCPYCGGTRCSKYRSTRWHCKDCQSNFSVLVGTIFQSSKIPLYKWFMAIYMLATYKKGVTSVQLANDLEITQKTAWFMNQKIRCAMEQDDNLRLFFAQCDETYVGGRETNKHTRKRTKGTQGRSYKTKTPVFGMVDMFGNAIVKVVPDTTKATLQPIIAKYVLPNGRVWTDEYASYKGLSALGFRHEIVCHKQRQFVKSNGVNTNAIEGFWGILKRMIWGTHHFVSRKYMQRYVDEAVFRHNTLNLTNEQKFDVLFDRFVKLDIEMIHQRQCKKYLLYPNSGNGICVA